MSRVGGPLLGDLPVFIGGAGPWIDDDHTNLNRLKKAAQARLLANRGVLDGATGPADLRRLGISHLINSGEYTLEKADIVANIVPLFQVAVTVFEHPPTKGPRDHLLDAVERLGAVLVVPDRPPVIVKLTVKRFRDIMPNLVTRRVLYHAEPLPQHGWGPSSHA